jgi:hypothetical protein
VTRWLLTAVALVALVGCRSAAERAVVQPLPDDAPPMTYADVLARARLQAMSANESFYIDDWSGLDDAARSLQQSARFLHQSKEVPADRKAALDSRADVLGQQAALLRTAAQQRNEVEANATLQRIHMLVRELRSGS